MNISGAQLGPLNLVGFGTLVQSGSWLLSGLLVWVGWNVGGLAVAGAGLMAGRGLLILQDTKIRKLLGVSVFDRQLFIQLFFLAGTVPLFWILCGLLPARREIPLFLSAANLLAILWLLFWFPSSLRKKH